MRRRATTMILISQAVLVMLATVVSTLVESNDLPSVPEDSKHMVELEGSEPLPKPDASHHDATHQLPHHGAVYPKPRNWNGDATTTEFSNGSILPRPRKTWFQKNCPTTVTRTVISTTVISPTVVSRVPEFPELPEDYCNGPGQFLFGATNECFLYLSDGLRSFEEADAECRKGGMRLAKPKKPKAIQKHLVTVLGHSGHIWLGARGDGHSFKWQTNDGASIRNTDPNWWIGMPASHVTKEYCLELVAYPNAVKEERAFYPASCSLKRTALCQREECSPQCAAGTCSGPNRCVYDPRSEAICPDGCVNGNCTGPYECTCSEGYEGDACDKSRCPKAKGFFQAEGSIQCYKYFHDSQRNWASAKQKCQDEGLVLAEPTNPLNLRKYIVEKYESYPYGYIGARGAGSYFRWERSGQQISNSDPLWYDGHPGSSVSSSYCLMLLTEKSSYLASYPNQPFHRDDCSTTRYTICEYLMK